MKNLAVEAIPEDLDFFLTNLQMRISIALADSYHYEPMTITPKNSRIGDTVYFTGKGAIAIEGLYVYKSSGWVLIG